MQREYPSQLHLLKQYGIQPKKSLGQNFIINDAVLDRIVTLCDLHADDRVVEIGAGLGGLTLRLADRAAVVFAVEKDKRLAHLLAEKIIKSKRVKVIQQDALLFDYPRAADAAGGQLVVVGNLPYNVASRLTVELIRQREYFKKMILMYQREVAERMTAQPGGKEYGVLTLLCNLHAEMTPLLSIGKEAFYPRPQVESKLLYFKFLPSPRVPVENEGWFIAVVKAAFAQRRKKLKNALKNIGGRELPNELVQVACETAGVDSDRRGETLDLAEFSRLASQLFSMLKTPET